MALAQIGFFTTAMESLATAVGAGMLLGGFMVGTFAIASGWSKSKRDDRALSGGYYGGVFAAVLVLADLAIDAVS